MSEGLVIASYIITYGGVIGYAGWLYIRARALEKHR